MGTTVSYPGIYVQEFTPGAPIQGVGTSTGAFIGTAASGPINQPMQIDSWDAFNTIFGGFIAQPPTSYLAPAVYGFFLNQGTTCYILRVGTGAMASAILLTQQTPPQPDLIATAIAEGIVGNTLSAQVIASSRLASMLKAAAAAAGFSAAQAQSPIAKIDSTGTILTLVSNTGFLPGDHILLSNPPAAAVTAVIASVSGATNVTLTTPVAVAFAGGTARTADLVPGQTAVRLTVPTGVVLTQALPTGASISVTLTGITENATIASVSGSTVTLAAGLANTYSMAGPALPQIALVPAPTLSVAQAESKIDGFDPTATILKLDLNTGFVPGDRIELSNGGPPITAVISSTQGTQFVVLLAPVPGATALIGGTARTADLYPGQLSFRVTVPNGLVLSQALPAGALITVTLGANHEYISVASSSGNTITLATGLVNSYSMAGPSSFPQIASVEFDLVVTGSTTETWPQLSMNPLHPGYWQTAVNSQLITLSQPPSPPTGALPNPNPAAAAYNLAGGVNDDRTAALNQLIVNPNNYLDMLTPFQDIDIVAMPGVTDPNAQAALVNYCETLYNRFAILDGILDTQLDASTGFPNLLTQYGQVRSQHGFAAIYFPWIQVVNPLTGATEYWPPSGHVMGIYAQTDQKQGVYWSPANVPIAGALGLQFQLTNADQGPLNLLGINILRVFPEQSQPLVFGARTSSTNTSWQYITTRRLFIYLEQSIEQGIRWAIFAPNNPMLWGQLKRTITEFLNRVQSDGGIISFYVRVDSALNPPATQALGQLFIEIGIQPAYPAEFIILRIGIWQGGSSVTET